MIFFFVRTYMMYAPLLGGFVGYVLWYEAFRSVSYTRHEEIVPIVHRGSIRGWRTVKFLIKY